MARIRSIHPGLFTDEAFASLSMTARVLLFGILTEADDHGVFEWKPITLKMRIMPADNVDVGALLGELMSANVVKSFQIGGRSFGLVRNFCKFQRPKKPSYKHVMPDELRTYAGLDGGGSETVPNQLPTRPENPPQREEEGGRMEEEGEERTLSVASDRAHDFEEFWKAYPSREGPNPRKPAETRFNALVKTGLNPGFLIAEVKKFAALDATRKNIGSRFIPQAVTWLNQQRWSDHAAVAFLADDPPLSPQQILEMALAMWARNGHWSRYAPGAPPGEPGCIATAEQLAAAGLDQRGRKLPMEAV